MIRGGRVTDFVVVIREPAWSFTVAERVVWVGVSTLECGRMSVMVREIVHQGLEARAAREGVEWETLWGVAVVYVRRAARGRRDLMVVGWVA